jgi:AraC-like DNA-binding protein
MREVGPARGILRHAPSPGEFHHARIAPSAALEHVVQHYWIVRWNLRGGQPQVRETLPHPNVHLVLDPGRTRIHGIHGGRFTRVLEGRGGVFGVKFRPGGFRPLLGRSVSTLRDRELLLQDVFGADAASLEADVFAQDGDTRQVAIMEAFLHRHAPPPDPAAARVGALVDAIADDRAITRVEHVAARGSLHPRALQRLFNDYVGVGPKWVINRYRLHEALERVAAGAEIDWSSLALELGYFDQAHFIRDFRAMVGRAPAEYARSDPSGD